MMKGLAQCVVVLSLFLLAPAVFADQEAAARLKKQLAGMQSLSGVFLQRLYDQDAVLIQETSGDFKVKKSGFLYWKVKPPFEQLVVSNNTYTWVLDPDLEQVNVYTADNAAGPLQILIGEFERLEEHYEVSISETKKGLSFQLLPKRDNVLNESFTRIEFSFDKKSTLSGLSMWDKLEQKTEIEFKSLKVNPRIDDNIFNFVVPEGVDLINNVE